MYRFLKEQLANCLHNVQSNWICLSSYLSFISIVTNCYLCPKGFRKKKDFCCFYFQLRNSAHNQLISRKCSGRHLPIRSQHHHHHHTCHWQSPCCVPGTAQAASSGLTTLGLHCSLIKCHSWPSFSSRGERLGLALKCAVETWHSWDLKQSWSTQCQSRCSRLSLKENAKH